jgi:hypothetical protein
MTANSHPLYRALREAVGERKTSRAFEAGVPVAGPHCGMLLSPQEVDDRIRTTRHEVMRRDQSRVD